MSANWLTEKFALWLEIEIASGDKRILDVVSFSARFPLNDIPRASAVIALGRREDTNEPSEIHLILDRLRVKRKVKVFLQITSLGNGGTGKSPPVPGDGNPFVVFEGYTVGPGYQRSSSSADYSLELEHWLSDLNYASATSALSSPQNPHQITFNAITADAAEAEEGVAKSGGFTGLTHAEKFITAGTVASDFWGDALQKFFLALCDEDTLIDSHPLADLGVDLEPLERGNAPAKAALKRIEPQPSKYEHGKPLKFDDKAYGGDLKNLAEQIEQALGFETLEVVSGSTLWEKLVQYAGTYMFAIAPAIERVLVIPFVPGLRSEYKTVLASEYSFVRISGDTPRILRGVAVYGGKTMDGNSDLSDGEGVNYDQFAVGGYFQGSKTGQLLFKQAPMWMAQANLSDGVDKVVGTDGNSVGDAINPGEGTATGKPTPKEKQEGNAKVMNEYAKVLYTYEILRLRSGDVQGKLRFDIGPGSVLKIEGCGEEFLGVDDQFGQTLFATVLQVDYSLNAEQASAATSFHLAHLRNELENTVDGFSLERHPFWTSTWTGAPLV